MLFFLRLLLVAIGLTCVELASTGTVAQSSWMNQAVTTALRSPFARPIVNAARNTMVKTATSVGVDWEGKAAMLTGARPDWDAVVAAIANENGPSFSVPEYYKQPFHAYDDGNLCLQAAVEQELAGKAVGARNFPSEGINGEVCASENAHWWDYYKGPDSVSSLPLCTHNYLAVGGRPSCASATRRSCGRWGAPCWPRGPRSWTSAAAPAPAPAAWPSSSRRRARSWASTCPPTWWAWAGAPCLHHYLVLYLTPCLTSIK